MDRRNRWAGRVAVLAVATSVAAGGCTNVDKTLERVPFFSFMTESPAFDPYEAPRPAPQHSVPFASPAGEMPPVTRPAGLPTEQWLVSLADSLDNPYPLNDQTAAAGQAIYETYCAVCHGVRGDGNGTVTATGSYPRLVPPLTTPRARGFTDEYIYGIIWAGRGLMPAYGDRIKSEERWLVVNYVRQLQRAASGGQAQQAAPTGR